MPTDMTNTISTNVSPNYGGKKVRYKIDFYILHLVLLVIIYSSRNRSLFPIIMQKRSRVVLKI